MRAQGDFKKVYEAAKSFFNNEDVYGGRPIDPVIRHTVDGVWMLESGVDPEPNADAECRLDDFDSYFYEAYKDDDYIPTKEDEDYFLETIRCEDSEEDY